MIQNLEQDTLAGQCYGPLSYGSWPARNSPPHWKDRRIHFWIISSHHVNFVKSVPTYGNYHGYYTKRPFISDERLASLPSSLFKGARVLDIGCNEGWVTCEIAQSHGAHFVVGVDIDDTLIQAAWRRRLAVWSTQGPSQPRHADDHDEEMVADSALPRRVITFQHPANMNSDPTNPAFIHRGKTAFPHNISFRTADWTRRKFQRIQRVMMSLLGKFSVSKWIHLNGGDEGLKHFFQRVHDVLKPGGTFVLEPQSWESYAKAKRMDQKLKENANKLVIRPSDFESILQNVGFSPAQHFGFIGEGGFNRPIDLYTKV
ncbi:Bicoid-interacting protein 3-domain-containing protein [Flammula alnicola]|nr:Bicoid-interacting protein 3-domain-containing protein [Flammula alnicola]